LRLRWTPTASHDLDAIEAYIAQNNPLAASQTVLRIIEQAGNLADHPGLGRPGRVAGTRELVISSTPYIVPYKAQGNEIVILVMEIACGLYNFRVSCRRSLEAFDLLSFASSA
jgi:addiction module RelE/StbE family toxin